MRKKNFGKYNIVAWLVLALLPLSSMAEECQETWKDFLKIPNFRVEEVALSGQPAMCVVHVPLDRCNAYPVHCETGKSESVMRLVVQMNCVGKWWLFTSEQIHLQFNGHMDPLPMKDKKARLVHQYCSKPYFSSQGERDGPEMSRDPQIPTFTHFRDSGADVELPISQLHLKGFPIASSFDAKAIQVTEVCFRYRKATPCFSFLPDMLENLGK